MRVLLIEDDTTLGEAVRDHVAADGHAVDWVKRLDEAEDARAGVSFDLILLDLNLPDGGGLDFLRRLRKRGEVTPVIILIMIVWMLFWKIVFGKRLHVRGVAAQVVLSFDGKKNIAF